MFSSTEFYNATDPSLKNLKKHKDGKISRDLVNLSYKRGTALDSKISAKAFKC